MSVTLYMPPDDYKHPPTDPIFKIGDRVHDKHPCNYGNGTVVSVSDHYFNRADEKVYRNQYTIDLDSGGTCVRFGYHLELLPCEHKWITFASGHQWKHQYCRSCGAEQRIDET